MSPFGRVKMLYSEKEVSTTRITKGLAYPPKGTSLKGANNTQRLNSFLIIIYNIHNARYNFLFIS